MMDIFLRVNLDLRPQALVEAIQNLIDTFLHIPARLKSKSLDNQSKESELADKEQARQLDAHKAELEKQKSLLEIKKQRIELNKSSLDYAITTATDLVDDRYPYLDEAARAKEIQVLQISILQYLNGGELEPGLSAPQAKISVTAEDEKGGKALEGQIISL